MKHKRSCKALEGILFAALLIGIYDLAELIAEKATMKIVRKYRRKRNENKCSNI